MSGRILTRDEYADGIPRFFRQARMEFVEYVMTLTEADFKTLALKRWDKAIEHYGPEKDLTASDLPAEADDEGLDGVAYWIMELIKEEREL